MDAIAEYEQVNKENSIMHEIKNWCDLQGLECSTCRNLWHKWTPDGHDPYCEAGKEIPYTDDECLKWEPIR